MKPSIEFLSVFEISDRPDWRKEIGELIKRKEEGSSVRATEAKKISRFSFIGANLYRRGFSTPLLKCISPEEAIYDMRELHEGACGMHTE